MKPIALRLGRTLLLLVPRGMTRTLLAKAAAAPPFFKGPTFERVCSAAVRTTLNGTNESVVTNFGISSTLRCQMPIAKTNYAFGRPRNALPERSTLALAKELPKDCRHFLDVGANEGVFTFVVADADPEHRVDIHWFEPDADLYGRLRANLRANTIRAHSNHAAISHKRGASLFFKNLSDDASGSLTDHFAHLHRTTPQMVETLRLSDYLDENDIHDALVKIDVEGAGLEAWSGAAPASSRITYLIMEMLAPEIENDLPRRIMAEAGMHGYYIRDFDLVVSREGRFRYVEPFLNWLFCRLDADCLSARLRGTPFRVIRSN